MDDTRTGEGTILYANGDRYQFRYSHITGKSTPNSLRLPYDCIHIVKVRLSGQLKNNKIHGKGKKAYANDDKYTGEWVNDNITGNGIYIYANGDRYEL